MPTHKKSSKALHYGSQHRGSHAVEAVMIFIVMLSLGLLAVELIFELSPNQLQLVRIADVTIGMTLLIEFLVRLKFSADKKHYLEHNWIFLLAALPLYYVFADALRIIRLGPVIRMLVLADHIGFEASNRKG